jgi:A/G-specific adenine glycosylase
MTGLSGISPEHRRKIRRRLLAWYDRNRRDLPWRRRPGDGYAQLLAEFMLQQTQVVTVVDYYKRFLKRFPTIQSLASADIDDVLALWSGLGYYSRARHLHAAAGRIIERFGGAVPRDVAALMSLPGVGRYTAGAISSITYDTRVAVLDGNVSRVLLRLLAITADAKAPAVQKHLWSQAQSLLPTKRCGDFNQAMMELGAAVCSPRSPDCPTCPLQSCCRACSEDLVDSIPRAKRRIRVLPMAAVVVAVRRGDRLLFAQRPNRGLWAGLWELPSEPLRNGEQPLDARHRIRKRLPKGCRIQTTAVGRVTRLLSHRRMTFHVYAGTAPSVVRTRTFDGRPAKWVGPDALNGMGLSRATEAILKLLKSSPLL